MPISQMRRPSLTGLKLLALRSESIWVREGRVGPLGGEGLYSCQPGLELPDGDAA